MVARLLWIPSFQPGSLFPAVPVVLELIGRGHDVIALCEAASRTSLSALGCGFRVARHLDDYQASAGRPAANVAAKRKWQERYTVALFEDVSEELTRSAYDLLIADPLELGAGFAAEAAGAPWCAYVHFAMDETGADTPFSFHLWDRSRPAADAFVDWWNGLRALVGLGPEDRPAEEHVWYRHSPHLTLILGLPQLVHPQGALPPYAVRVGPTAWDPPLDGTLPDWVASVGRERPAILVSVSTLRDAALDLIRMVGDAALGEGLDVVATVPGDHEMPAVPGNVRLAPFIPHSALLGRVTLVACQAGYGTVTRAACAGVPQLLFPDGRDRFNAARGAVAAGVAVAIEPGDRGMENVKRAIRTLLGDPSYRLRAHQLAGSALTYRADATSADHVETLLRSAG